MGGQAVGAAAHVAPAVLAIDIARDAGLEPEFIGVYTALVFLAAAISSLASGGLIGQRGAIWSVQCGVVLSGLGCALAATGHPAGIYASAIVVGLGYGPMTPASSVALSRWSPPSRLGLIMSIKQTGVPMGYFATGLLAPLAAETIGWRDGLLGLAAFCSVFALAMTPAARRLDEAGPRVGGGFASARRSLGLLKAHSGLMRIAFASFTFAGVQVAVTSFLVVYLEDHIGLSKQLAAWPLAVAGIAAIAGRIGWGWLADGTPAPLLLTLLPALMALCLGLLLLCGPAWGLAPLTLLGLAIGLSVLAWNGVMLIETARQAPPGEVGLATSGVLALTFLGSTLFPLVLSQTVSWFQSYEIGFGAMIVLSTLVIFAYAPRAFEKGAFKKT